jgi:hypothetical protein
MKKGCGCLFQIAALSTLVIVGFGALLIVSQNKSTTPVLQSNCQYLSAEYDKDGNFMKLYSVKSQVDFAEFREICIQFKADNAGRDTSRYVVLFDAPENATFPSNPYTEQFGLSPAINHVLAIYEFNPLNGFSSLTTYKQNMATSKPNIEKL